MAAAKRKPATNKHGVDYLDTSAQTEFVEEVAIEEVVDETPEAEIEEVVGETPEAETEEEVEELLSDSYEKPLKDLSINLASSSARIKKKYSSEVEVVSGVPDFMERDSTGAKPARKIKLDPRKVFPTMGGR